MTQRYLTPEQMGLACFLWEQKKWDTLQIAEHLKVQESVVYRSLAERRDERFRMRAIARRMAS
jgi:ribonuclease D